MERQIAIGGIWHETNTFASGLTTMADFENYQLARGDEIVARYVATNTELGGVLDCVESASFKAVPTLFASAVPSGVIEAGTARTLCDELVSRIQNALPLDGLILVLHGAAVAEEASDYDAYIVQRIREAVGEQIPIVATFDFHANLSEELVSKSTVLVGYDTYPHVDMSERGREAVEILASILEKNQCPASAFRKLPLVTTPLKQPTTEFPMTVIMEELKKAEKIPGICCGSVAMGFCFSDVPNLGTSVVMYGESRSVADQAADALAMKIWELRSEFSVELISAKAGVSQAIEAMDYPVVIVESADNVGGGSAGDATGVLQELLVQNATKAVIVVYDPQAVAEAENVGVNNSISIMVGGKSDQLHGASQRVDGQVRLIVDAKYEHRGSYMTGYVTSMGRTAVIDADGVQIVLTSLRTMPFDAEQLRCVGIEPAEQKIIVVKSAIAWQAAYGNYAKSVVYVDTPGVCSSDLTRFNFDYRPEPLYPLELDTEYTTGATA